MWINCHAGSSAPFWAEKLAKEHNGFTVDAGDYNGGHPAIAVFSEVEDLLKGSHRWEDIIDNYLPISKQEYCNKYLTTITFKGFGFLVRAYHIDEGWFKSWFLVVEYSSDLPDSHGILSEMDQLPEDIQQTLKNKFLSLQKHEKEPAQSPAMETIQALA